MAINSRQALQTYALTKLGEPVISVNVSQEQLDDRLDEALQTFQQEHLNGIEQLYFTHQVTCSQFVLTSNNAQTFDNQSTITGHTSGATATVVNITNFPNRNVISTGNTLYIKGIVGTFVAGETIGNGIVTGVISAVSNFLTLGDTENKYITLPDGVISVLELMQLSNNNYATVDPFSILYQIRLNDFYNMSTTSMIYYTQMQQHLSLINMTLVGNKPIRFNQHQHKISIDMDWLNYVVPGEFLMIKCWGMIDPNTYTDVYNNQWLKAYFTALLKQNWGANLSKFSNQVLPGGIVLNGDKIYEQATNELLILKEELHSTWTQKADFYIG